MASQKGAPDIAQYYFAEITPLVQQQIELNPALVCAIRYLLTSLIVQKMCSHYLAPRLPFVRQHGAHILYLQERKKKKKKAELPKTEKGKSESGHVIQQGMQARSLTGCCALIQIITAQRLLSRGPNGLKTGQQSAAQRCEYESLDTDAGHTDSTKI